MIFKVFKPFLCLILIAGTCSLYAQRMSPAKIDSILKTGKEDTSRVNALNALCKMSIQRGKFSTADSLGKVSLALCEKLGYKLGKSVAYRNIGNTFFAQGNFPEALKNQLMSLKIAEEIGNTIGMDNAYTNIGNIYGAQGNDPEALKNFLLSLKLAEKVNDKEDMARDYGNIAIIYSHEGGYTEALKNQQKALKIDEEIGNKYGMGVIYAGMGNNYFAQGNYAEALKNQLQSLAITREIGDKDGQCFTYECIGSIYIKEKKFPLAKAYLDSALTLSMQSGDKELIRETYFNRAQLDSVTGNFGAAYKDYRMLIMYRDSLNNEENTRKIVSQQMNYEFNKKQAEEKAEQDKKDAIAMADKKRQQILTASVSVGLLLVLVFSIVLFSRFRITQRQKTLIETQKKVVEEQKQLVEQQKALVEEKNKDITDSIHYASRIQRALLTTDEYISQSIKDYFILFKPRDIVSGDFYWAFRNATLEDTFYLACCDCTGHGVPGAFMSLLNISMLNESVIERKINRPDLVLNDVRDKIIKALNPDGQDTGKDGMDASLCVFDLKNKMLHASCANNPVWIVKKDKTLVKIDADKMPVGIQYGEQKPFSLKTTQLSEGDCIYMFTDGFADQFGGPSGKKFKYEQLKDKLLSLTGLNMAKQKEQLEKVFEEWKGSLEQVDDVLIMGIRV